MDWLLEQELFFVATIKWLEVFDTGIPFIDDDHRHLVDIINTIEKAHEAKDIAGCRLALGEFLDEAKAHFHREEKYLQTINFPNQASHARHHRELIDEVVELLTHLQPDGETGEEPKLEDALIEDTLFFLLEDVIKADAEIKSFDA